jgi:hypothetical protein
LDCICAPLWRRCVVAGVWGQDKHGFLFQQACASQYGNRSAPNLNAQPSCENESDRVRRSRIHPVFKDGERRRLERVWMHSRQDWELVLSLHSSLDIFQAAILVKVQETQCLFVVVPQSIILRFSSVYNARLPRDGQQVALLRGSHVA